ncbi:16016_t:CDS:10 [Entrophospora sp. SA101]|nr:16016_t:CDS:10 [Entrophospora sp. SA101]
MSVLETELQISTDEEGLENKVSNNLNDDKLKKLRIATDSLGGHAVIGELSKPYDILTNTIMELIKKNYNSFEFAQYSKKIYQNYYNNLLSLIAALKKSQQLITDLSFLWNLHKFRTTNIIKRRFERVTKEFDKVLSDLKLEKPFDFVTQKKKDLKAVEHDISIITKFLERAEGSITIPSDELINIYNQFVRKDQYGGAGNVKVRKWLSSGGGSGIEKKKKTKSILVACKRYEQQPQKFFDNLILLPKLNNCPNILKFYALSVVKDWNYHNSTNSKQLRHKKRSAYYTYKCDIFSFGMLLWELAFNKIPYRGWSPLQISNHVLAGFREPPQPPVTNKDSNLDIVPTVNSSLMMTLDEGIKAHENGDFLKAWECFNSHHMIGNKLEATYWRGHYLYEGYHGEININEAIDLFKLAADQGIPDAQFSYAKSLIENYDDDYYGGGCDKDILNYLELAAHGGGVSSAFYILGNIYLYGKHNEKSNENNDSNEPKKDFDISTVDIKAAAMSWNSFANPNIKDRDDGLASTLNYYNYYQRSPYQQRYNLYKQPPYSQDYVNWKQNVTYQGTNNVKTNNNINVRNDNNDHVKGDDNVKNNRNDNSIKNNNTNDRNDNDKSNKENRNNNNNDSNYDNHNNLTTIPSSSLNSQSDKNPSSPEQDYYYDSCSMLDPVLEQNYPTNPKRVDKHDRGQILLTINVEFEDGHTQAICVHVNDEPADLAKDFCDLWGVTNPVVEPAFEGLIKEEKDKRLGSL